MFNCFFFSSRRRHTRCLSDWSSDVCSSDLFRMAPVTVQRLVKELEKLKEQVDAGTLKARDYDERLARIIRELREQGLDADRAAITAALADVAKRGIITPEVQEHLRHRPRLARERRARARSPCWA